jgi:hypothetical protein
MTGSTKVTIKTPEREWELLVDKSGDEYILTVIGEFPVKMGYVGPLESYPTFYGATLQEAMDRAEKELPKIWCKREGK